jgi:hypothetical protein
MLYKQRNFMQNKHLLITSLVVAMGLGGPMDNCEAQDSVATTANPVVAAEKKEVPEQNLFLTFFENRVYVLGNFDLQKLFTETKEVALRRTRIGEGPDGATLVFGMTKDDAKRGGPTDAELLYDGKLQPAGSFYGEVFKNGRFYVFVTWADMEAYLKQGDVSLTFTEIGAGPKGETVIYALNKESAKLGRPVAAIDRFHKQHSASTK